MDGSAVTFDFHNTLVRCEPWFDLEVRRLPSAYLRWQASQSGRPLEPAVLEAADAAYLHLRRRIVEHGDEETAEACVAIILADLDLPIDESSIAAGVEHLMRETLTGAAAMPGAVDTVRALAAAGVPLGIVSAAVYHPFLEWALERVGLRDAFADVTTSASAGWYKGRPELFWHAADRLGADPAAMVHVGDSYRWDVGGARRAGLRAVWVTSDPADTPVDGVRPDLTLTSLDGAAAPILDLVRAGAGR